MVGPRYDEDNQAITNTNTKVGVDPNPQDMKFRDTEVQNRAVESIMNSFSEEFPENIYSERVAREDQLLDNDFDWAKFLDPTDPGIVTKFQEWWNANKWSSRPITS